MNVKKLLAGAGVIGMIASASVFGLASPAQAAPQITVTPNSNLKGGQVVTVTFTGFSPNAPVAIGVCADSRVKNGIKGSGDCGRTKVGAAKLATADASGKGTAKITIIEGDLNNATPPAEKCPPCSMAAQNIASLPERASTPLKYASASSSNKSSSNKSSSTSKNAAAPKDETADQALPKTGPRETAITALIGFAVLQVGLVLAVRSHRAAPRRRAAL